MPGCTGEEVKYTLECQKCRSQGTKRAYIGESSKSSYQRGREHAREVREGVLDHPMVQHFWEEHKGEEQEIILRVLGRHLKALYRQIEESILIERTSEVKAQCLNLKSEWAGSKIPGLSVSNPKGLMYAGECLEGKEEMETFKEATVKDSSNF